MHASIIFYVSHSTNQLSISTYTAVSFFVIRIITHTSGTAHFENRSRQIKKKKTLLFNRTIIKPLLKNSKINTIFIDRFVLTASGTVRSLVAISQAEIADTAIEISIPYLVIFCFLPLNLTSDPYQYQIYR